MAGTELQTDVQSSDFTVIARNPSEMAAAQGSMILWSHAKIESEKELLVEAEQQLAIAVKSKWSTAAWRRRVKLSTERIQFYEKLQVALEAGYYIVPPFPIDIIAVRTDEYRPRYRTSDDKEMLANAKLLPVGKGRYVSSHLEVGKNDRYGRKEDGSIDYDNVVSTWYQARDFQAVEFPFKTAKVEIMDETSKAFALKVFDRFGVLPKPTSPHIAVRRDPIICGQILAPHKNREPVTFFVAWWLDTKSL